MHLEPNIAFTGEQTEASERKGAAAKPRENMRMVGTAVPIMVRSTSLEHQLQRKLDFPRVVCGGDLSKSP